MSHMLYPFFEATKHHICEIRGINASDAINTSKATNRAILLFILDMILANHRHEYASPLFPLLGKDALHHKLLMKYRWPIDVIKNMNLHDTVFALQDEISAFSLAGTLQEYDYKIQFKNHTVAFTDILDAEWDPNLLEQYLQPRRLTKRNYECN